jgi:putative ABC transport system substrate-binding protein
MTITIGRRKFIATLGGAALWPFAARAQQRALPVIGYLDNQSLEVGEDARREEFRRGLKDNGFIEGDNVAIQYFFSGYRRERLPELLAELVRRRVAVIVAASGPISVAASKATTTIPVVFMVPEDPVRLGLVDSLARPGRNVTGVNFFATETVTKRLGLLHQLVPASQRIGVLLNPAEGVIAETTRREVESSGRAMGLQIQIYRASSSAEIDAAFADMARDRPDALFVSSGPFFGSRRVQLVNLASRHAIPAIYGNRAHPEAGGLISYGTDARFRYRQSGIYAGLILKGAKPEDLPVVQSTKFELVINAQTARMLGIDVPPALYAIADEVIE